MKIERKYIRYLAHNKCPLNIKCYKNHLAELKKKLGTCE